MEPVNINGVIQLPITRVLDGNPETQNDWLAVEEPLEIRLEWTEEEKRRAMSVAVTMRTPGDDEELAAGFLLTEAIINDAHHISSIKACGPVQKAKGHQNIIRVTLSDGCAVDPKKLSRHVFTTSSCGICGKASIDAIRSSNPFSEALQRQGDIPTFNLSAEQLCRLPQQLSDDQRLFQQTGGIHAAALVDETGCGHAPELQASGRKMNHRQCQSNQCGPSEPQRGVPWNYLTNGFFGSAKCAIALSQIINALSHGVRIDDKRSSSWVQSSLRRSRRK